MIYRISAIFLSLLLSFSAVAGDNQSVAGSMANASAPTATEIDFTPSLSVMGVESGSVDCASGLTNADGEPVLAQGGCCRICTVGKACGDSCISRNYTCHKGRGCACNG